VVLTAVAALDAEAAVRTGGWGRAMSRTGTKEQVARARAREARLSLLADRNAQDERIEAAVAAALLAWEDRTTAAAKVEEAERDTAAGLGGDLGTAERQFTEGLRQVPDYMPLLAGRARVEAARGQTDQAVKDWQVVTTRLPQPIYLIEYADLLTSLGRGQEAASQYALVDATAALFRAQGANVDLELSLFDADRGRPAEALTAAKAQIDLRQSTAVEDAYAWALHVSGRDAEALVHAKAADHLGMKNALFAYHRGVIEQSLGNKGEAMTWLQRSLEINPYFSPLLAPKAKAALTALQSGA
jgi:tetratricopeptide (TPR) repeat protein